MAFINNEEKLRMFMKILKGKALDHGYKENELYPKFLLTYEQDQDRFDLPRQIVLDIALEILSGKQKPEYLFQYDLAPE